MEYFECPSCKKLKSKRNYYILWDGRRVKTCKFCYNFKNSIRFLDYQQLGINRLRSSEEKEIADRLLRKERVKKVLRG